MSTCLRRASLRHLWRHPLQFGLSLLGIALGVAVVTSVDLANDSARRAFELSRDAVNGRATHRVVGGPRGLPEELFARLRLVAGQRASAPAVEGWAQVPGGDRTLQLLGLDPLSESPFRPWLAPSAGTFELGALLAQPGCLLTRDAAAELAVGPGDPLVLQVEGRRRQLSVAALLEPADALGARALRDLVVVDVSTAQELLGMRGRLSRIDLRLQGDAEAGRIAALLPPGADLVPVRSERTAAEMTRAFGVNLAALALLALLCGAFLIYNAMTFSVVQRRPLIGVLRALGVTRGEIARLMLAEALVLGVAGTGLGLAAGLVLARGLVRLVSRTINDLYFVVSVRELAIEPGSLAVAAALGVGVTVLAALHPLREATRQPPRAVLQRSTLEAGARRASPRLALVGLALLGIGAVGLGLSGTRLTASFAALFVLVVGFALLTPGAVLLTMRALATPARRLGGLLGGMAPRGVAAVLSRTAVAIAALMIATSVIIGVGVMIDSFRRSVAEWLDATLTADLYVSAVAPTGADGELRLAPGTLPAIESFASVESVRTIRRVTLESADGPTRLLVLGGRDAPGFELVHGDPRSAWPAFEGGAVVISEPYAFRHDLGPGDAVVLRTARGPRPFAVAGVYTDYTTDRGVVAMSRSTYDRWWDDPEISGFSVQARPGADLEDLAERIRSRLSGAAFVQPQGRLRQASLEVFDRTFLITGVLRTLVTLVAFVGVLGALAALQLERTREIGVLRAIGLTPAQVWGLVTAQSGLMGAAAGLLALPVGLTLAALMIFVINRRSFGWSMDMVVAPGLLLQALSLAVAAALLAGLWPAWRMSRLPAAEALREE